MFAKTILFSVISPQTMTHCKKHATSPAHGMGATRLIAHVGDQPRELGTIAELDKLYSAPDDDGRLPRRLTGVVPADPNV